MTTSRIEPRHPDPVALFYYCHARSNRSDQPDGLMTRNEREGGFTGQSPWAAWRSVWHTPQASVLTRIWPTWGEGTSHSRSSNGFPNCSTTAAFILSGMEGSSLVLRPSEDSRLTTDP